MHSRTTALLSAVALAAAGLFSVLAGPASAQDKPAVAPPPSSAAPAAPAIGKYYELRIYTPAPGKLDALNARFRDHTTKLFEKHGIVNVGYWVSIDEKNAGKLYYVIAYPDKASRDKMWDAFAKDPEWLKAKEASEVDGKLVEKVEQVFMTATDYSPVK